VSVIIPSEKMLVPIVWNRGFQTPKFKYDVSASASFGSSVQ